MPNWAKKYRRAVLIPMMIEQVREEIAKEVHRYYWNINQAKLHGETFQSPEKINALLDDAVSKILQISFNGVTIEEALKKYKGG